VAVGPPLLRRRRGSYGVESTNNIRSFPGRVVAIGFLPREPAEHTGLYTHCA
jgi:hypothetical protein